MIFNKFTILVPVYNSEKTIQKTLDCLTPLSERGIPVLVSDNSSSDKTRDVLKNFETYKNFKIFYQDKNYGSYNFIFLLEQVKTKWVLFIGSDDYLVNANNLIDEFDKYLKDVKFNCSRDEALRISKKNSATIDF